MINNIIWVEVLSLDRKRAIYNVIYVTSNDGRVFNIKYFAPESINRFKASRDTNYIWSWMIG